jgi:hypothetical protein
VRDHAHIDGEGEDSAQRLQEMVGRFRRARLSANEITDMAASETANGLAAMFGAKAFKDISP